jgi:hypothetical protein
MSAAAIRRGALIAVLMLVAAREARTQSGSGLTITPGTEVRLTPRAPEVPRVRGRVVVLARDTIVLRDGESISRTAVADLAAIEVRGGEDKRRGFLIGAGIAGGITAIFGGIDASKGEITNDDLIGTFILNSLIGGLVGYAFAPKGWERIPLPDPVRERRP